MFVFGGKSDNSRCCPTLFEWRKIKCLLFYLDFLTTKAEPANSWRVTKNGSSAVLMTAYFGWSGVFSPIWAVGLWRIIRRCQIFKTGCTRIRLSQKILLPRKFLKSPHQEPMNF